MGWEWAPPTFVALLALIEVWRARSAVKSLHVEVNSKMDKLLEATSDLAGRRGHDAGVADERRRRAHEESDD